MGSDESELLYCHIYIYAEQGFQDLLLLTQQLTIGRFEVVSTVKNGKLVIDVRASDDRDAQRATSFPRGFLYFPYYLDVWPEPETDKATYIMAVGNLLKQFWARGIAAVASCDFEDELPHSGGRSRECPWPE